MAKTSDIKGVLIAYAGALEAAGAGEVAGDLQYVASALDQLAVSAIPALAKVASEKQGSQRRKYPRIVGPIEGLLELLSACKGNAKIAKDLKVLCTVLKQFDESQTLKVIVESLGDAMQPKPIDQQVDDFIARLSAEKGTPTFEQTFANLARSDLKREHVVSIALSVYGGIKKATSRKAALEFIRKPHDARVSARRGIEATGGRSAA